MHIISASNPPVDICRSPVEIVWHLPEVEWHEATVTLTEPQSPHGEPVSCWQIDSLYDGTTFRATWSSDRGHRRRTSSAGELQRQARIRVPRHDGPCVLAVRVETWNGEPVTSVISRNRR
jgi:hypothetical protein